MWGGMGILRTHTQLSQPEPHRGNTARLWAKHKMNNFRRKTALNDLFIYPLDKSADMS